MSNKYTALLEQILEGVSLSEGEAHGLMHEMASGEMEPALAGALLMGTSLVLEVVGLAADLTEGVVLAADTIDSGKAAKFLGNFRAHFAA